VEIAADINVLVVQGDPNSSFLLCLQLKHLGYERITLSETLADAHERVLASDQRRPALVVLDLRDDMIATTAPLATAIRGQGIAFIAVVGRQQGMLPPAYDAAIVLTRPPGLSDVIDAFCLARGHDPWG